MNTRRWSALPLALLLVGAQFVTGAVAKDDAGSNDYAKALLGTTHSCVPLVRKYESVCGANFTDDKNSRQWPTAGTQALEETKSDATKFDLRAIDSACAGFSPADLPEVRKGQKIAVRLMHGYVHDFNEMGWRRIVRLAAKGEIAMVARVAEQSSGTDIDFVGGINRGRLVYYSEGVTERTPLNFSQLPIYGPIEYTGKPLLLEFHVVEVDSGENVQITEMLAKTAGLGAVAYAPAAPVLKILETIGSGLITANDNDIEFKYHALLHPAAGAQPQLAGGVLEYGNYIFVRMPSPKKEGEHSQVHPWSSWWFNNKNGRLFKDASCTRPELDHTYFTVQLNRGDEEASLDAANTFGAFIDKVSTAKKTDIQRKLAFIDTLSSDLQQNDKYAKSRQLLDFALRQRWGRTGNTLCRVELPSNALAALEKVVADVKDARATKPPTGAYDPHQVEVLIDGLARLTDLKMISQTFDAELLKEGLKVTDPGCTPAN